jgi:hypothetical protein
MPYGGKMRSKSAWLFSLLLFLLAPTLALAEPQPLYLFTISAPVTIGATGPFQVLYIDIDYESANPWRSGFRAYMGAIGKPQRLGIAEARTMSGGANIRFADGSVLNVPRPGSLNAVPTLVDKSGDSYTLTSVVPSPQNLADYSVDPADPETALPWEKATKIAESHDWRPASLPVAAGNAIVQQAYANALGQAIIHFQFGSLPFATTIAFWSPSGLDGPYYELPITYHGGGGDDLSARFRAPSLAQPERIADISTKPGKLFVACEGDSQCFKQVDAGTRSRIEAAIRAGTIALIGLPNARTVVQSFKIEGRSRDTYVVVDGPLFPTPPLFANDLHAFVGEGGRLAAVRVLGVQQSPIERIIALANGKIIYAPALASEPARFIDFLEDRAEAGHGEVLRRLEGSSELAVALGLDPRRFDVSALQVPVRAPGAGNAPAGAPRRACEGFFTSEI